MSYNTFSKLFLVSSFLSPFLSSRIKMTYRVIEQGSIATTQKTSEGKKEYRLIKQAAFFRVDPN